ncbi:saccharopine dehydrogenase C-terminal domain-containing protein [Streptomyces sp. NPDC005775]|uniref:saccharopine dehydrogenase C-terminal domain-containing protein n=1 Tax=unclassified Streptomyces TaxID=2593676 RepID=UPI0033D3B46E
MTETVPAGGTVHWIGTGLSNGGGLALLCDRADRVVVHGRTREKARQLLERLGLTGRATTAALDPDALAATLNRGDVVVSMLPATEHARLLRICEESGAHFACSSYTSEEMAAAGPAAEADGRVILTEAGLDPGIDHLLAHQLVSRARSAVGEDARDVRFTSYCGGLPAEPNDFRYRFSWAPRGVLTALLSPARHVADGEERVVERPWEAVVAHRAGGETFEVYPNRDSLPFLDQYGFPAGWQVRQFVRGTLRLDGWQKAWEPVFEELRTGSAESVGALADRLAARYPTGPEDRDRVVLSVELTAHDAAGRPWQGSYFLDLRGGADESAMARCVSVPLAYGVTRVLDGAVPAGLHRAAGSGEEAARWISFLNDYGIRCTYEESYE